MSDMKKEKKWIITVVGILFVIGIVASIVISSLKDSDKITLEEKQWITDNTSNVQHINVINNINVYGKNGNGVFFDFINDFGKNYNLTMNPITFNKEDEVNGVSLKVTDHEVNEGTLFYEDYYVLVSKKEEMVLGLNSLSGKTVGIYTKCQQHIQNYVTDIENLNLKSYDTKDTLLSSLNLAEEPSDYILVPKIEYLDSILSLDYKIVYHFNDIKEYYYLDVADTTLGSIMRKYYSKWKETNQEASTQKAMLNLFMESLNITQKELDDVTSKEYHYGFLNNSPYEVLSSGSYGGIISTYLKEFSDFLGIEFRFTKYRNAQKFNDALQKDKVDLFFNFYNNDIEYQSVSTGIPVSFVILAENSDTTVIHSLRSLTDKTLYVEQNSLLANYFKAYPYIHLETYKNEKELKKLLKNNNMVAIDEKIYEYYENTKYKNYQPRYKETLKTAYAFKTKDNATFNKLFQKFVNTLDANVLTIKGLQNHAQTMKNGALLSQIAKYILLFVAGCIALWVILYKSRRRIRIAKKIKKEDKIRFIDELTSLKNRNYLNENIISWNNNTLYPQTVIMIDLNNIQEINDTLGYEQGDTQIKAAANILIKTQLDNSDIIRTDGNEFMVYLVGYQQRQIVSYIRKLYKEFKTLPHEYGATLGYSMITDDIKTIEDAMNEAVEDMKNKKEETVEE